LHKSASQVHNIPPLAQFIIPLMVEPLMNMEVIAGKKKGRDCVGARHRRCSFFKRKSRPLKRSYGILLVVHW